MAAFVFAAVFVTATISGTLGMAGGMILMGLYAAALPVGTAMVLHGVTQLASNGSRAYLTRQHFYLRTVGWYLLGAGAALAVFTYLTVVVDRGTVFIVLGGAPIAAALIPKRVALAFERPSHAAACGVVTTSAQLIAGASGPLLDIFFLRSRLDRYQVVATKALTQSMGHAFKLVYYGVLVNAGSADVAWWIYPGVVVAAFAGSRTGRALLDRLSEVQFRRWTARVVLAIGSVYAARGAWELWL